MYSALRELIQKASIDLVFREEEPFPVSKLEMSASPFSVCHEDMIKVFRSH